VIDGAAGVAAGGVVPVVVRNGIDLCWQSALERLVG